MKAPILMLAILLPLSRGPAKYSGGSGAAQDPYQIATAADLIALGETPGDYNKHFILTADLDLDPNLPGRKVFDRAVIAAQWNPPFAGIFDGNGHTISHLTVEGKDYLGLFGRLELGAMIMDLGLVDVAIIGSSGYVGGLAGYNDGGTVMQCHSSGAVSGTYSVGGLVGHNAGSIDMSSSTASVSGASDVGGLLGTNRGSVVYCHSTGSVSSTGEYGGVGGLVGYNYGTLTQCYSTGTVSGSSWEAGGLVGGNCGLITHSYSTGAVTGKYSVGGLVGGNWCHVSRCYSTGSVRGEDDVGGLAGSNLQDSVTAGFWDVEASGQAESAGGTGKTTAELQTAKTFLDAGWDLAGETANGTDDIWWILEGKDYPRLTPLLTSFSPDPPDGWPDSVQPVLLRWVPGASARYHEVYFSEDKVQVADATPRSRGVYRGRQPAQRTTYDPGVLEHGKTYYWRIDEVSEADPNSTCKGKIWRFTTVDFVMVRVIDDFESYNQDLCAIFDVWIDGVTDGLSGSVVGHMHAPFAEQTIFHGGWQSMPMTYNNCGPAYYSEVARTWKPPQDWMIGEADALTLYFCGSSDNTPESLYAGVEDSAGQLALVRHPATEAVLATQWRKWHIPMADLRSAGVNVTAVKKMYIGVGDRNNPQPNGTGRIWIDDIGLTKRTP